MLLPELWPAEESAEERTVRAVVDLRGFVAETLTRNAEASAARTAAVVRLEVQRLVEHGAKELHDAAAISREVTAATVAASREAMESGAATSRQAVEATSIALRETMAAAAATIEATARQSDARAREDAVRAAQTVEAAVAGAVSQRSPISRGSLGAQLEGGPRRLSSTAAG